MTRETIYFGGPGDRREAWLYRPEALGRRPAVVLAHGLGGIKDMRLDAYARRFSAEGYVCIAFDYRHFGGSDGQPRQLLDLPSQRQDWHAALAFARSRPEIDPDRVVIWGTSFGGGHALAVAAEDHQVAAVIAQCPFTNGFASTAATSLRSLLKVTAIAVADRAGSMFGRPPRYIATAGRPGSLALMSSADSLPGYLALVDAPARAAGFHNYVAARAGLQINRATPGRRTRDIACPILFVLCGTDAVAPARSAFRYALRARQAEIHLYQVGHFDIYVGDPFQKAITDMIAFLRFHVPLDSIPRLNGT